MYLLCQGWRKAWEAGAGLLLLAQFLPAPAGGRRPQRRELLALAKVPKCWILTGSFCPVFLFPLKNPKGVQHILVQDLGLTVCSELHKLLSLF